MKRIILGCIILIAFFSCKKNKNSACHRCTTTVYVTQPNGSSSWQTSLDTSFCNNDSLYNLLNKTINGSYYKHSCY